MPNLFDYLDWRGDLPLEITPFCEVDGLVFSQLAYIRWENADFIQERPPIKNVLPIIEDDLFKTLATNQEDKKFLPLAAKCRRFGEVRIEESISEYDEDEEKQFSATTYLLPDETLFVAYRGTDDTQIGWKEDFNMAFMPLVPSQMRALEYLTKISDRYPNPIRVGGHSKGGNLAVYAAVAAEEKIQDRILGVYCNDGPGYNENVKPIERYERIRDRIHAFVPQSSIVGMLLLHLEDYKIIRSTASGIMQHDPYSWEIKGGQFVEEPQLKEDSKFTEVVLKKWLSELSTQDRKVLINALFDIISAADVKTFGSEMWLSLVQNPLTYLNAIQNMDESDRNLVSSALGSLAKTALGMIGNKNQEPENSDKAS